jgi:hypothetical protein
VFVTWKDGETREDVKVVEVGVALDEDDAMGGRELLGEDGGSVHASVRAA